jgi:hypothetical protein
LRAKLKNAVYAGPEVSCKRLRSIFFAFYFSGSRFYKNKTLPHPDDVFAAKKCGDLIPRAILFMETLKKGLVVKFLARNFLSQLLYHLFFRSRSGGKIE